MPRFNQNRTPKQTYAISIFEGCDFAKESSNVELFRSPDPLNMTRDEVGKVRKRMGYHQIHDFETDSPIYGIFSHVLESEPDIVRGKLVHMGNKLYAIKNDQERIDVSIRDLSGNEAYLNEGFSSAYSHNNKTYIVDGKGYWVCEGYECKAVTGYIPTIKIAGTRLGGGTPFEPMNLLSNEWEEKFITSVGNVELKLAFDNIDDVIECYTYRLFGTTYGWWKITDYTVDKVKGSIMSSYFNVDPILPGEDNVRVRVKKARTENNRSIIDNCSIMTGFGYNGKENQIFLSGNPKFPNRDYWSAIDDPTYFPDINYSILGQDKSSIVGYSKLGNYLATHTMAGDIFVRGGKQTERDGIIDIEYPVAGTINGSGTICRRGFQSFNSEPLFITNQGVQTITAQDLTAKEIEQNRGDRINKKLLSEPSLENAVTCVYKDLFLIAVNGNVYTLDRLQKYYEPNQPYSTFQYAGSFWDNIPAICFYIDDGLYFGTKDGKIMKFYTDEKDMNSYNDNGKPIYARWELPEFDGELFFKNKNIKFIAIKLKSAARTGVIISAKIRGIWEEIYRDFASFGYFDFNHLDFSRLNFSTDATPKKAQTKIKIKKVDKVAFKFENYELNEPFGIYDIAFIYTEKGVNKRG